jgi:hypothetical protein
MTGEDGGFGVQHGGLKRRQHSPTLRGVGYRPSPPSWPCAAVRVSRQSASLPRRGSRAVVAGRGVWSPTWGSLKQEEFNMFPQSSSRLAAHAHSAAQRTRAHRPQPHPPGPLSSRFVGLTMTAGCSPREEVTRRAKPVNGTSRLPDPPTAIRRSRCHLLGPWLREGAAALPSGEQWRAYDKTIQARLVALPSAPRGEVEVGPNMGGGSRRQAQAGMPGVYSSSLP